MEFTNEILQDMQNKQAYNRLYGNWYYGMSEELKSVAVTRSNTLKNRSNRIQSCLDFWEWDMYYENKIMDLQRVNRCFNNRFCPNCRKMDLAKFIHHYREPFNKFLREGYYPYLITLTVPNVVGEELRDTIDKMNKSFNRFFKLFNQPIGKQEHGYKGRYMTFDGALKVLEITYNSDANTFHPHFHCMFFSKEYDEPLFNKKHLGPYSNKRKEYIFHSDMDIHIMKLWYMCYEKIRMNEKNYNQLSDHWSDLYLCDIREMDSQGIYEVLKYTFKDTDVSSYYVFKTLVDTLENKRIRQGYGLLQGLKTENTDEGNKIELEEYLKENKKETPDKEIIKGLSTLIRDYHTYTKISRFKAYDEMENLK